jgi:hypothetical protein
MQWLSRGGCFRQAPQMRAPPASWRAHRLHREVGWLHLARQSAQKRAPGQRLQMAHWLGSASSAVLQCWLSRESHVA